MDLTGTGGNTVDDVTVDTGEIQRSRSQGTHLDQFLNTRRYEKIAGYCMSAKYTDYYSLARQRRFPFGEARNDMDKAFHAVMDNAGIMVPLILSDRAKAISI
jgi:hypothetical protein